MIVVRPWIWTLKRRSKLKKEDIEFSIYGRDGVLTSSVDQSQQSSTGRR